MSLFGRIKKILGLGKPSEGKKKKAAPPARPHDVFHKPPTKRPGDDEWANYWDTPTERLWTRFARMFGTSPGGNVRAAFDSGWIDPAESSPGRIEARESLFTFMKRHSVDITEFPWAEWRNWYETQTVR